MLAALAGILGRFHHHRRSSPTARDFPLLRQPAHPYRICGSLQAMARLIPIGQQIIVLSRKGIRSFAVS